MKITEVTADVMLIQDVAGLDPIHAIWINVGPGIGYVTLMCFGCAWTAYFGAMNGRTIQAFFASVDVDYMVNAMSYRSTLKVGKRYEAYLARIVKAVQEALIVEVAA